MGGAWQRGYRGTVQKLITVQFVTDLGYQTNDLFVKGVCVCVCVHTGACGQTDRCWTAIVMDFNAYWVALPTGGRHTCRRPGMPGSMHGWAEVKATHMIRGEGITKV